MLATGFDAHASYPMNGGPGSHPRAGAASSFAPMCPNSRDRRQFVRRRDRNRCMRRCADPDRCGSIRCGPASCGVGKPGRVAWGWVSTTVLDEYSPRTCKVPAHIGVYAVLEAIDDSSRFAGRVGTSMTRSGVSNCSILLTFRKIPCCPGRGERNARSWTVQYCSARRSRTDHHENAWGARPRCRC
jgi:hypothetical protein